MINLEFRVLGPFVVVGPEGLISLPSARQRAILASLVLDRGTTVPADRLIDEVWGERPPSTARHALSVHVGAMRRIIGPGVIETRSGGYRLRADGGYLDLDRFEALADEAETASEAGNPATAADRYATALGLWRGPALADLAPERAIVSARARLDARRTRVTELWLDAELAAGRHADVVPPLRRLVAEEPLRESLQARLMIALYRSGRQAEALAVYHEAREVLDRELGVEPGPALEAAQQAILAHDPSIGLHEPPSPAPGSTTTRAAAELEPGHDEVDQRPGRRTVTVLFAELSGPATSDTLDPESTQRPSADIFEQMRGVVERHGGTVQPFVGDVVVALFGSPVVHEDDALRAVRATADLLNAVSSLVVDPASDADSRISLRVGLNTGEIVTTERGGPLTVVAGAVVNAAAHLCAVAAAGEVLMSEPTYRLVRRAGEVVAAGPIELPGPTEHASVYRLSASTRGTEGHQIRLDSPLVGRQRELAQLGTVLERAIADETCQLFTLLGPAGAGKSRLVHEFLGTVRQEALVLRGRCLPYGEQVGFWPVAETVKQAVGIDDRDDALSGRHKIEAILSGAPRASLVAERVAGAIGLSAGPTSGEDTAWAIRSLFERLARQRPLVIVFDDVQWGEPAFLDLIEYLSDAVRDAPVMLLCIARPELLDERPGWSGGKLNATSVLLTPLQEVEVSQLVSNLLGGTLVPPTLERKLVDAAEGNPLFVEEFLGMLIDDGVVQRGGAGWVPTTDLSSIPIPGSIMALLTARLDRLPPIELAVTARAAVIGKVFSREALDVLAEALGLQAVDAALTSLARRELIRADRSVADVDNTYRFKHILIRDAAYLGVPKHERIVLHERLADWLVAAGRNVSGLDDELIGAHLEQAYRYRIELGPIDDRAREIGHRAGERLAAAGRRALFRGNPGAAKDLLKRAVALLPLDGHERPLALADLTSALIAGTEFAEARRINHELLNYALASGQDDLRWHATLNGLNADIQYTKSVPPATVESLEAAIGYFQGVNDDRALARAWSLLSDVYMAAGQLIQVRGCQERAVEHARRVVDHRLEGGALIEIAYVDLVGPATVADATRSAQGLVDWALDAGSLFFEAVGLAFLGRLKAMAGEFEEGRRIVGTAIAMSGELGRYHQIDNISRWIGLVEWLAGDPAAAEQGLRRGHEEYERLDSPGRSALITVELARMLYLQNRIDEADEYTRIGETSASTTIDAHIGWLGLRGMILARRGERAPAIALARTAVELAENTDLVLFHARALEDLAAVLQLSGQLAEARPALASAIALYEAKGITALARRARANAIALS